MCRWALFTLVFAVGGATTTAASGHDRSLAQFHHTAWTARQGAPSQVWALAQTADGYLWIGAATGLYRFDGVRFERYQPPAGTAALPSTQVLALQALPDGGLWVSFQSGALGLLADGQMRLFTRPDELPQSTVYGFACDEDGRLWAAGDRGLAIRDGERWRRIGADRQLVDGTRTRIIGIDRAGTLWLYAGERVLFLPRGGTAFQATPLRVTELAQVAQAPDGTLWMAETRGSVRPLPLPGQATGADIAVGSQAMLFDRAGSLWITSLGDGLRRVRQPRPHGDNAVEAFTQAEGLSGDYMTAILEDREGNVWTGTGQGIDRFRRGHLVPVALPPGHQHFSLLAGDDGEVWVASASSKPLLRVRGETLTPMPIAAILTGHRDADGTFWWGGYEGLWQHAGERFELHRFPDEVTPGHWIMRSLHRDRGGGLRAAITGQGVFGFLDGRWTGLDASYGLGGETPTAVYEDPAGRVWLAYSDDRAHVVDGDRERSYSSADGLAVGRTSVIRGRGPHLWFGGNRGLALFQDDRFRTIAAAGEPFGDVLAIVETADGELWLSGAQAIVRVPAAQVRRALDDPAYAVHGERFDYLDGLPGAPQMNRPFLSAIEASDGRLWFATDSGLAWIDPARIARNTLPPTVLIRAVEADGAAHAPSAALRLPPGTQHLRVDYTATSLSIPERVRFRYRLEDYDADWQEAGTRREAFYTTPGPGDYRFQVIAANNDGIWNETGASMQIVIPPTFVQSNGFLALCATATAALLWLAYLIRLRHISARLRSRLEERLVERERIARELHDTLLQGVQGLILRFQAASERIPEHEPARRLMEQALDRADEVLVEGRDRVKGLRARPDSITELSQALAAVAADLAQEYPVVFRILVEGAPRALHPVACDEVFLIGREALINAFHHAQARTIEADVVYDRRELRLRVRDDGRGIDAGTLSDGHPDHWGLTGMRERAQKLGARLAIWSRTGAGTEIELRVPAGTAYARRPDPRRRWLRRWLPWRRDSR